MMDHHEFQQFGPQFGAPGPEYGPPLEPSSGEPGNYIPEDGVFGVEVDTSVVHGSPARGDTPELPLGDDLDSQVPTADLSLDGGNEPNPDPTPPPGVGSVPVEVPEPTAAPILPPADAPSPHVHDAELDQPPRYVDPVDHFNAMHEHPALARPEPRRWTPQLEGDPAAVAEITTAIEEAGGQIPFSQYMDLALYGAGGYYSQGKPEFQAPTETGDGDFLTSPERSADFSRAINAGVCTIAEAMGNQPFNLVELGAGSGRMTKDVLATMRNENPEAYQNANVYIADYGGMRSRQEETIGSNARAHSGSYAARSTTEEHAQDLAKVTWVPGSALELELANDRPTIVMANEVWDAICADVVRFSEGEWEQKFVASEEGELVERWLPPTEEVRAYIDKYGTVVEPGKEVAVSPGAVDLQRRISQLVNPGGFIGIDYGREGPKQADSTDWTPGPIKMLLGDPMGTWYRPGATRTYPINFNPLQMPGELDITYDPDFAVLRRTSEEEGLSVAFYGPQRDFLTTFGVPHWQDLEVIGDQPGLSESSIRQIRTAQALQSPTFKVLVVTRGVEVDFSTPRPPLPGYREFYGL